MPNTDTIRFSIDTGGTFTDIVVLNETTSAFYIDKAPTTPEDTTRGVIDAIDKAGVDLTKVKRFFVHGSTTALNALLQGKGVPTAYVGTRGFRDVPQIMRYNRPELYNPKYHKPRQIVPRHLRYEVTERMNARGEVLTPLDEEDARRVAREIRETGVSSVAVCLLHAHKNALHEERLREILLEEAPGLSVAISSGVAPEHREFERSMTTILNAYLAPVVEQWLTNLQRELTVRGFTGQLVLTKSDGGGMTAEAAKRSPINMLLSGPAGGVIGGVYMSEAMGRPNLVTMDVGGTSFDVAMIKGGVAATQQQTSANGYPILISTCDIRSIGAGGGSLASVDAAGALTVGPESAGAVPGPICYGRGGTQPTTTDAFAITGYINPEYFLGGRMRLDVESAGAYTRAKIAQPLGLSLDEAASGILRIATASMAEAVKSIASEGGDDLRDFGMLCFGGGGPLFGAFIMDELELPVAIIPIVPSVFSAWGMLMVDLRQDLVRAVTLPAAELTDEYLGAGASELAARGNALLESDGVPEAARELSFSVDTRYAGQEHTVNVPLEVLGRVEGSAARLIASFEEVYEQTFGYRLGLPAELVNLRLTAVGRMPRPELRPALERGAAPPPKSRRRVFDFLDRKWTACDIYDRESLRPGARVAGPALIEEATTTTVVRRRQELSVDQLGNLIITRSA